MFKKSEALIWFWQKFQIILDSKIFLNAELIDRFQPLRFVTLSSIMSSMVAFNHNPWCETFHILKLFFLN